MSETNEPRTRTHTYIDHARVGLLQLATSILKEDNQQINADNVVTTAEKLAKFAEVTQTIVEHPLDFGSTVG